MWLATTLSVTIWLGLLITFGVHAPLVHAVLACPILVAIATALRRRSRSNSHT